LTAAAVVIGLAVVVLFVRRGTFISPAVRPPPPIPEVSDGGTGADIDADRPTVLAENIPPYHIAPGTEDAPSIDAGTTTAEGPVIDDDSDIVDRPRTEDEAGTGETAKQTTAPGEEPAVERPVRSPEEALESVRVVLAGSPRLADHVQTLLSDPRHLEDDRMSVGCVLPGLLDPVHVLTLSLDPDQPPLSQEDTEALESRIRAVDALIGGASTMLADHVKAVVAGVMDSRFVNTDRLQVRLDTDLEWRLSDDAIGWKTRDAGMT
ncbi:unnamed protein product, partial [marine sediment metagenome]